MLGRPAIAAAPLTVKSTDGICPKLTKENWLNWNSLLTSFLASRGLLPHISVVDAALLAAAGPPLLAYQLNDLMVTIFIKQSVSGEILSHIRSPDLDCRATYAILKTLCNPNTEIRQLTLRRDLSRTTLGSRNISQLDTSLCSLFEMLAETGDILNNAAKINALITALPPEYESAIG